MGTPAVDDPAFYHAAPTGAHGRHPGSAAHSLRWRAMSTLPARPLPITLMPLGQVVPAAAGQTLFEAAHGAGVSLPVSCRNGTCRACRCRCLSGRVAYRVAWPGLSAEEKAEGWVLPCVAVPETAVTLDVPLARPATLGPTPGPTGEPHA